MSMTNTDRENWRKALGIKESSTALDAARAGIDIGKTSGRAGGASSGGSIDSDTIPEGDDEQGAEKGDGAADFGKKLKVGDKFDRAEDLYDCETGEEVTLDGFGEKGSESYPSGFENCEAEKKPSMSDLDGATIFITTVSKIGGDVDFPTEKFWSLSNAKFNSLKSYAYNAANQDTNHDNGCEVKVTVNSDNGTSGDYIAVQGRYVVGSGCKNDWGGYRVQYQTSSSQKDKQDYIDNFEASVWPSANTNHLTWNKDKGCFEPLCPELNTQVLDKYKACEPERILCDKDGNKVKVTIDGDTVKVTQAKYNQTAEVRNGKVVAVKKLTESQTEAEFK